MTQQKVTPVTASTALTVLVLALVVAIAGQIVLKPLLNPFYGVGSVVVAALIVGLLYRYWVNSNWNATGLFALAAALLVLWGNVVPSPSTDLMSFVVPIVAAFLFSALVANSGKSLSTVALLLVYTLVVSLVGFFLLHQLLPTWNLGDTITTALVVAGLYRYWSARGWSNTVVFFIVSTLLLLFGTVLFATILAFSSTSLIVTIVVGLAFAVLAVNRARLTALTTA